MDEPGKSSLTATQHNYNCHPQLLHLIICLIHLPIFVTHFLSLSFSKLSVKDPNFLQKNQVMCCLLLSAHHTLQDQKRKFRWDPSFFVIKCVVWSKMIGVKLPMDLSPEQMGPRFGSCPV